MQNCPHPERAGTRDKAARNKGRCPHPGPLPEYPARGREKSSAGCAAVRERGFTLVELLTVLIIITILIGILLPTISHIRRTAYATSVQAQIGALRQAIDQYYADFHSYPGPVSNAAMGTQSAADQVLMDPTYTGTFPNNFPVQTNITPYITGPENLVLGLMGGLHVSQLAAGGRGGAVRNQATYNPTLVAQGPVTLNTGLPKKFGAYVDNSDLSAAFNSTGNGLYGDAIVPSGSMDDSPVPEILDRFPNKMPILYIRATVGATMYLGSNGNTYPATPLDNQNPVVINAADSSYGSSTGQTGYAGFAGGATGPLIRYAEYDISQILAYTKSYSAGCIGEGKTPPTYITGGTAQTPSTPTHGLQSVGAGDVLNSVAGNTSYTYPYPAYPYFKDPNSPAYSYANNTAVLPYARAKDTYILISAGIDRVYGTADDITSFGDVRP